jgi:hypothetical protein
MEPIRIDAREALRDIQSGMDDSALMQKYHLSTRGVQSLYAKLVEAGLIRALNPRDVINDIWSGMSDADLMSKHRLSPRGLERLFKDLEDFNLFQLVRPKKNKRATVIVFTKEVVDDIRAGLSELDLMAKYELSAPCLQRLFKKLLAIGVIQPSDLLALSGTEEDTAKITETRRLVRCFPVLTLYVCDLPVGMIVGTVSDITEHGVRVNGIAANKGDVKHFWCAAQDYREFKPFSFKAVCRWGHAAVVNSKRVSGFEIMEINQINLSNLQDFIASATITFGQPWQNATWPEPVLAASLWGKGWNEDCSCEGGVH